VIGDIISPFKAVLGDGYRKIERRLLAAVHLRFGLPHETPPRLAARVKEADRLAASLEAVNLAGFSPDEARRFFGAAPADLGRALVRHLTPWPVAEAGAAFLDSFAALEAARRPRGPLTA